MILIGLHKHSRSAAQSGAPGQPRTRGDCVEGTWSRTSAEAWTTNIMLYVSESAWGQSGGHRRHDCRGLDERRLGNLLRFIRDGIGDEEGSLCWSQTASRHGMDAPDWSRPNRCIHRLPSEEAFPYHGS